jgi:predicted nucleic acid-binding protein
VARIIVLDAGPLGLASKPRGKPDADRCRAAWVRALDASGSRVVVPEITDYEVRRELLRVGAKAGIGQLDKLEAVLDYDPITTLAMRRAAEFWALIRRAGTPTADPHALDADCILTAQASLLSGPGDVVTIATTNPRHLTRFPGIDAHLWETIVG